MHLTPEILFDEMTDVSAGTFHLGGAWWSVVVAGAVDSIWGGVAYPREKV